MVLVVLALVCGRLAWLQARHPAHLSEITEAFGSVRLFSGPPQASHDGRYVTYIASAETRAALFLANTSTGHREKVVENDTAGWNGFGDLHAGPWAPDDSAFIYFLHDKLVIQPADAHPPAAQFIVSGDAVAEVVWLNPQEIAYRNHGAICCAQKAADGTWSTHESLIHLESVSSLTAVSSNDVAWLQDNLICRWSLTNTAPVDPLAIPTSNAETLKLTNGLALWVDASKLQQEDQTPVSHLADQSLNRNDLVPNSVPPSYNSPQGRRALGGKGTIHFTSDTIISNSAGLKTARPLGITNTMPRTVFAVLSRDRGPGVTVMAVHLGEAGGHGTYFGVSDQSDAAYLPAGWDYLDSTVPPPADGWNLLEVVYDGASQKGYINGMLKRVSTFGLNTTDKEVEIGRRSGNQGVGSDGDFAELLIYDRALTDRERQQVEDYLGRKWLGRQWLAPQNPLVWQDPQMAGLSSFSYSTKTGQFLISRSDNGQNSLWRFIPEAEGTNRMSEVPGSSLFRNPQWMGPDDFVCLSDKPGHRGVIWADGTGKEKARLFANGRVEYLAAAPVGNQIFALGTVSNEPSAGIWQYDLATKQLQAVVPCANSTSIYARNNFPSCGNLCLPSGRKVFSFLYPPLNFDPHKKYPLVILSTTYLVRQNGEPEQQWVRGAAACGAYVLILNRDEWYAGIEQWGENVLGAYQNLIHDPTIDASRVFLAGSSAETPYVSEFIEQHPGLWRGVALIGPTGLPDFSKSPIGQHRPRLLIEESSDGRGPEFYKSFQKEALDQGSLVEVVIHPDEAHHIIGNTARLERTRNLMHFIFED